MSTLHTVGHLQHIRLQGIVKQFPGVLACDRIDFEVTSGEIHALLGENGAGKSTLMKVLYGLYQPEGGQILFDGKPVTIHSPQDAIRLGVGMIHQHFMLVPALTVVENVALGLKTSFFTGLNLDEIADKLQALAEKYKLKVDLHVPIWQLSVGEQQRVEILRAIYKGANVLILDEPTAVLTPQEVDDLTRILDQMRREGRLIIFITHKLQEVLNISDRVTVLRDGRVVGSVATDDATKESLAHMMVGRPVVLRPERTPHEIGEVRLELQGVSCLNDRGNAGLSDVSLNVRSGEIVGIAGVSGNGQHELAEVITGLRSLQTGTITIDGQSVVNVSRAKINAMGVSYIPEERMVDGVIKDFTVAENRVLVEHSQKPYVRGGIFINSSAIEVACRETIDTYQIKTPSTSTLIKSLSGGNIQKLVLGRELARNPNILIAAQPTRGVDIGAIEYIHKCLLEERDNGTAILLISEDLEEIRALADRIIVLYEGRVMGIFGEDATLEQLGTSMAGIQG